MKPTADQNGPLPLYIQHLLEELHSRTQHTTSTTILSVLLLLIVMAYQLSSWLDYPILSLSELIWNSVISATPSRLISVMESTLLPASTEQDLPDAGISDTKTHAQKSDIMRRVLGLNGNSIFSKFQQAKSLPAVGTMLRSNKNDKPPGLGNWDNSCYQNSVIQGLASLPSFAVFLASASSDHSATSTKTSLKDIVEKLKNPANLGGMFWTPAPLKSMSSWQQQDAQEYFSKLMDEVEKETILIKASKVGHVGLAALQIPPSDQAKPSAVGLTRSPEPEIQRSKETQALRRLPDEVQSIMARNPLEGLLAQRVGCLKCGFVEGLSLIPFNCLTLPLGKHWLYDIRSCLDEYTTLEPINGVDCARCTLLQTKIRLEKLQAQFLDDTGKELQSSAPMVSEVLRGSVKERLSAVTEALDGEDFTDNTILKKCQISPKARVSSTKTRQAVIARAPESLAIHINRSVFNEMTGVLSKNYADVRFPLRFSLAPWCLGGQTGIQNDIVEHWNTDPAESMLAEDISAEEDECTGPQSYELRAALTHYGRHENGHYICYRRHQQHADGKSNSLEHHEGSSWWRFSDEDVSSVSEEDVLAQGDVFMLFYERVASPSSPMPTEPAIIKQQPISELTTVKMNSVPTEDIRPNIDDKERLTARVIEDEVEAQDEDRSNCDMGHFLKSLSDHDTHGAEIDAKSTLEISAGANEENGQPPNVHFEAPPPAPAPSHNRFESDISDNSLPNETGITTPPHPTSFPHNTHPSLFPAPSQTPSTSETRNVAHSMRTATPRSGRGSVSQGKKMGQVSRVISSH
ncbi:MAG: hypothetical protein Q9182_006440 [Xanthomendoza sp. 2 TL-2023]